MEKNTKKRGRPVGSANKPKSNGGLFNIKFEKQVEGAAITRDSSMGYIKWGLKNDYPTLMLDLYNESPTHRACINFEVQSIIAGGVDYDAMSIDKSQIVPNYQYSWDYLLRSIALDYSIFGSYAIQIILNKDRKTFSFWHIPMDKVRCSPYDEDGQITSYWISSDWSALGQNPPIELPAFDMREETKIEYGQPYIYVYKPYDPTMTYYQTPFYSAGIKAIQSEIEYIRFDERTVNNNFIPAGILRLNEVSDDNERDAVIRNVTNLFTGANNANALMVSFRSNIEEQDPSFTPFTANVGNVNLYADANARTLNRILSAHQIPNASLVGLPDVVGSGFASEADKLETAFQLYQRLTGNYHRQCVIQTFNQMLAINGVDTELILKPLKLNDFGDENDTSNDNGAKKTDQDVSTDNIEEKEDGSNSK